MHVILFCYVDIKVFVYVLSDHADKSFLLYFIMFTGYERDVFINETRFDSEPYVDAIRHVIMNTFYAVLVVIGLVIVIAAIGYALFQYLKSRNMIRVIKIYQMDKEEQTYGAIYRSVKRRQTVKRHQRRLHREESQRGVKVVGNRRRRGISNVLLIYFDLNVHPMLSMMKILGSIIMLMLHTEHAARYIGISIYYGKQI